MSTPRLITMIGLGCGIIHAGAQGIPDQNRSPTQLQKILGTTSDLVSPDHVHAVWRRLMAMTQHGSWEVRATAASALGTCVSLVPQEALKEAATILLTLLQSQGMGDERERQAVASALVDFAYFPHFAPNHDIKKNIEAPGPHDSIWRTIYASHPT